MGPFPIAVDIAVTVVAVVLGVFYGRRLAARGVRLHAKIRMRDARALVILALVFIFGSTAFIVIRNLPTVAWYVPTAVEYGAIPVGLAVDLLTMGFCFGAVGGMAFRQRHRFRWVMVVVGVLALGVGEQAVRYSPWARPPTLDAPLRNNDGIILQSSGATCAAAACANVVGAFGMEMSERQMVLMLGTTDDGTTPAQVVYGLRKLGFRCVKRRVRDGDFTQLHAPAVLFVAVHVPLDHAVAYMGTRGSSAEIRDPQTGIRLMTRDELRRNWRGHAIEVYADAPPPDRVAARY